MGLNSLKLVLLLTDLVFAVFAGLETLVHPNPLCAQVWTPKQPARLSCVLEEPKPTILRAAWLVRSLSASALLDVLSASSGLLTKDVRNQEALEDVAFLPTS